MRQRHAAIRNAEVSHVATPNHHPNTQLPPINKVLTAHPFPPRTQVRRLRLVTASPAVVAGLADGGHTGVARAQVRVFYVSDCLPILTLCFITEPDSRGGSNAAAWCVSYIISVCGIRLTPCFVCVQVSNPFSSAGQQPEGGDASTTVSEGRRALRQLVSIF